MHILNIAKAIKKMSINAIEELIIRNYYKRIGFSKESSYHSMKHMKKKILSLVNELIKGYLILAMLKKLSIISKKENMKISKGITKNYFSN